MFVLIKWIGFINDKPIETLLVEWIRLIDSQVTLYIVLYLVLISSMLQWVQQ